MPREDTSELLNALAPALRAAAKNVVRHAYGPDGLPWGTRFSAVEDMAVQVGNALARAVLHLALQDQATRTRPQDVTACPRCAGPLEERPAAPRELQAEPGLLAWDEPAAYCPRCRRAFFPSGQEPGP